MFKRLFNIDLNTNNSIFIFGPRGTGKTQWIKQALQGTDHIYLDLLDSKLYRELKAKPETLQQYISKDFKGWIIIDEVQRIPEILNEVHRAIEHQNQRFILTGSSARKLKRHGVNLLAGRALRYHMHPLTIQELGSAFNLEHALTLGMLPATYTYDNPEKYLETYVETYLREEVQQEGLTRSMSAFARFLEVASFSQGNTINATEIAREIGIDRQVVMNYFSILNDLLLSHHLPVFTKRAKRKLAQKDKFYFFDAGVYNQLRPKGFLDNPSNIGGAALETLILQSMLSVIDYYNLNIDLYYWRTVSGVEVDFIAYSEQTLVAIEVKHAEHITPKMLNGLKRFLEDYPMANAYIFYRGAKVLYLADNIIAVPIKEALQKLPDILSGQPIDK